MGPITNNWVKGCPTCAGPTSQPQIHDCANPSVERDYQRAFHYIPVVHQYDPNHPHDGGYDPETGQTFAGIRGSCDFCVCTSPLHTINGRRYCKACFDERFVLVEKQKGD